MTSKKLHKNFTTFFKVIDTEAIIGFLIVTLLFFSVFFVKQTSARFTKYNQAVEQSKVNLEEEGTKYLLNEAKLKVERGSYKAAVVDYAYAYKTNPDKEEIYQLLIQTLSIVSKQDSTYNKMLNSYLKHHLKE